MGEPAIDGVVGDDGTIHLIVGFTEDQLRGLRSEMAGSVGEDLER